jgi:EAL and modified HD-GYP domain-containing signal transduction protein
MLTGIFLLIDTLLNRNLVDILNDLPLTDDIQEALLGTKNDLYQVFSWSIQIEHFNGK